MLILRLANHTTLLQISGSGYLNLYAYALDVLKGTASEQLFYKVTPNHRFFFLNAEKVQKLHLERALEKHSILAIYDKRIVIRSQNCWKLLKWFGFVSLRLAQVLETNIFFPACR